MIKLSSILGYYSSSITESSLSTSNSFEIKAPTPVSYAIAKNAGQGKSSLINTATYIHSEYKYLPKMNNKNGGQLCGKTFVDDLDILPQQYDYYEYETFIRKYGTHIIIGVQFGGTITTVTPFNDKCDLKDNNEYSTVSAAVEGYLEEIGEFTVYRNFPNTRFLGHEVNRLTMHICGGKASVFTSTDNR